MSVYTRFAIEYPSNAFHTSIPIPTLAQAASIHTLAQAAPIHTLAQAAPIHTLAQSAPSIPEKRTKSRTSLSCFWKGICDFATEILKSKTRKLEEKNQVLEEKNKSLQEKNQKLEENNQLLAAKSNLLEEEAILMQSKLAEISQREQRTSEWLEDKVDRGTRGIEAVLKSHMDEFHEKRISELQIFMQLFLRHEEVYLQYWSYKEGYELLKDECETANQKIRTLTEQNNELDNTTKILDDLLNEERYKVSMFEQTLYGVRGSSSSQQ